jgi:hypothetical protein
MSDQSTRHVKGAGFGADATGVHLAPARFVVSDMQAAHNATSQNQTHRLPIELTSGVVAQVALSNVQPVSDGVDDPAPDWNFSGTVEDPASAFDGRSVHGYVLGYDTAALGDVYVQVLDEPSAGNGGKSDQSA